MTPSDTAKSYGAKSLKEVAEYHKISTQWMWRLFNKNFDEFDRLCWEWAKKNSPHSSMMRRAFIDGILCLNQPIETAEVIAITKGYSK